MPVETAADLATFFNADEFASAATYSTPAGAEVECSVLINRADIRDQMAGTGFVGDQAVIAVRVSEVVTPERRGVFTVAGRSYRIAETPRREDLDRLVWTCNCQVLGP